MRFVPALLLGGALIAWDASQAWGRHRELPPRLYIVCRDGNPTARLRTARHGVASALQLCDELRDGRCVFQPHLGTEETVVPVGRRRVRRIHYFWHDEPRTRRVFFRCRRPSDEAAASAQLRARSRPRVVIPCRDGVLADHGICDVDQAKNRFCAFSFGCPECWPRCRVACRAGAIVRVGDGRLFRPPGPGRVVVLRCRRG